MLHISYIDKKAIFLTKPFYEKMILLVKALFEVAPKNDALLFFWEKEVATIIKIFYKVLCCLWKTWKTNDGSDYAATNVACPIVND